MGFLPPLFLQEHSGEEMDTQGENWTKREGLEHTGRELGTQGGSGTPKRAEPSAVREQPHSALPSSQGEQSEAKVTSACSETCTEPQLSLLMTKGLETTAAPPAKGLK